VLITRGFGTSYGTGPSTPTYIGVEDPGMATSSDGTLSVSGQEYKPSIGADFEAEKPNIKAFENPLSLESDFQDLRPNMSGKES